MTKQRLVNYIKLKLEIKALEESIKTAERFGTDAVIDVVKSAAEFPYKKHDTVIKGFGSSSIPRLRARLVEKKLECQAIENFVNSINDSIMWQLLTFLYIEDKKIREAAALVNYSESRVKQLLKEFFEKLILD